MRTIVRVVRVKCHAALIGLCLLSSCAKQATVKEPAGDVAYRITRADGVVMIVKYPAGPKTINELMNEFGCKGQTCIMEIIRLKDHKAGL